MSRSDSAAVDPREIPGHSDRAPDGARTVVPAWSASAMVEQLGGDETLARELVSLFLNEYPKLLENLHESLASGESDRVRRAAHAAKGCIANFIEGGPQATAHQIEQLGASGRLADVASLLARLEREIAFLAAPMTAFRQEAP